MNNFNKFYEKSKIEEEIKAKKTKASWEDAKRGESSSQFKDSDTYCQEEESSSMLDWDPQTLVTPPFLMPVDV